MRSQLADYLDGSVNIYSSVGNVYMVDKDWNAAVHYNQTWILTKSFIHFTLDFPKKLARINLLPQ